VLWGLGAAVGLAVFFILSARSDSELPPLAMASGGMTIGAITLLVLGAVGALPMAATTNDVDFAGRQVSWLVPVIGLSVIAAALAYVVGISAARILGSKLASFVGLTEVLFAVLFAWLFLGQLPTGMQLVGGVLIVAGVALVRVDELRAPADPAAADDTSGGSSPGPQGPGGAPIAANVTEEPRVDDLGRAVER
jgi:drug/metabolite transporter (DMT)-like permease